jgi:hypothetical protein
MSADLRTCPFCGSDSAFWQSEHDADGLGLFWAIRCGECGNGTQQHYVSHGNDDPQFRAEVRAKWNSRSSTELLAALTECGEWFGLTKPPLDQWEDLAEEFRKETGFLRPGKDYPMGAGLTEEQEAERSAVWKTWSEARRDRMIANVRAAIRNATGEA